MEDLVWRIVVALGLLFFAGVIFAFLGYVYWWWVDMVGTRIDLEDARKQIDAANKEIEIFRHRLNGDWICEGCQLWFDGIEEPPAWVDSEGVSLCDTCAVGVDEGVE